MRGRLQVCICRFRGDDPLNLEKIMDMDFGDETGSIRGDQDASQEVLSRGIFKSIVI